MFAIRSLSTFTFDVHFRSSDPDKIVRVHNPILFLLRPSRRHPRSTSWPRLSWLASGQIGLWTRRLVRWRGLVAHSLPRGLCHTARRPSDPRSASWLARERPYMGRQSLWHACTLRQNPGD